MENNEGIDSGRAGFTAYCPHCRREAIFVHARLRNQRHLLLTLVTAGAWAVVWAALFIGKCLRPWRCGVCGWHKPEFRKAIPLSRSKPQAP
jgi:hypothetical protein